MIHLTPRHYRILKPEKIKEIKEHNHHWWKLWGLKIRSKVTNTSQDDIDFFILHEYYGLRYGFIKS